MALRRWLVSQGRVEEALVIMKRLEKSNGTTVPAGVYQQFEVSLRSVVVDARRFHGNSLTTHLVFFPPGQLHQAQEAGGRR